MAVDGQEDPEGTVSFEAPIEQLLKGSGSARRPVSTPSISYSNSDRRAAPAEPTDEKPVEYHEGDQIGRFLLIRALGRGGMGLVFLAQDPELLREVALKVLLPEKGTASATSAQARMLREAQAMAMLTHPHLVGIYEVGVFEEHVFLAMEYVIGQTLEEWLSEGHPLEDVMEVFDQAGRALHAVHKAGLVHRDFKPDNVMVTPDGVAKVLDFGIARKLSQSDANEAMRQSQKDRIEETVKKLEDSPGPHHRHSSGIKSLISSPDGDAFEGHLTAQGAIVGTPEFMAPEQLSAGEVGHYTDQFSFAIALFRALAKTHPFPGDNYVRVMTNIMIGERRDWPDGCEAPEKLRRAINRALSSEPHDRWPSMDAFLDACREGLGLRGQIRFLTSRWASRDQSREYLLAPGALLDEGRVLLREQRHALTDEQAEYIMASARAVRRRRVQRRALMGGVAALGLGMIPILSLLEERNEQLQEADYRQITLQVEGLKVRILPLLRGAAEDLYLLFDQRHAWMPALPKLLSSLERLASRAESEDTIEQIRLLNDYFRPLIARRSMISSAMIARDDEFELLFFQDPDAKNLKPPYAFYNRLIYNPLLNERAFEVFWGANIHAPTRFRVLESGAGDSRGIPWRGYVPTERVWFRHAAARPQAQATWTTPYLFFVTKDAGVTGSLHWMEDGHKYVLAADFMLTDFSEITTSIEEEGLQAAVLTYGDGIVGLPRDSRFDTPEKVRAYFSQFNPLSKRKGQLDSEAELPSVKDLGGALAAAAASPARKVGIYSFDFRGKKLWAGLEPVGSKELGLSVLVVQTGKGRGA